MKIIHLSDEQVYCPLRCAFCLTLFTIFSIIVQYRDCVKNWNFPPWKIGSIYFAPVYSCIHGPWWYSDAKEEGFNIIMSYQYRVSHYKDKMVVIYNGQFHTRKDFILRKSPEHHAIDLLFSEYSSFNTIQERVRYWKPIRYVYAQVSLFKVVWMLLKYSCFTKLRVMPIHFTTNTSFWCLEYLTSLIWRYLGC